MTLQDVVMLSFMVIAISQTSLIVFERWRHNGIVTALLKANILARLNASGDWIPINKLQLAAEYKVQPKLAGKALDQLIEEGRVVKGNKRDERLGVPMAIYKATLPPA